MGFRFKIHHFQPNLGRRLAWPWDAMPGWRRKWPCSTRYSPGSSGATRWASGQETSRRNGQKVGKTTTKIWGWTKHSIWMMDLGCLMMFDVWILVHLLGISGAKRCGREVLMDLNGSFALEHRWRAFSLSLSLSLSFRQKVLCLAAVVGILR